MLIQKHFSVSQLDFPLQKAIQLIEGYWADFNPPRVVVGGSLNTGKTTLVNSLLQEDTLFPVNNTPCPVIFTYGLKFTARIWRKGRFWLTLDPRELSYFLKQKTDQKKPEKVEVTLHHNLLRLCSIIDTPGVDSPSWDQSTAEQIFSGAGQIIYLFHQRGIQIYDRHFLQRLKELLGQNSYKVFSFWLNCNAGRPDGTSLASTRAVLRDLFGAEVTVHTLNTYVRASVSALAGFLQEKLIDQLLFQMEARLRREDSLLPQMLAKLSALDGETDFLLNFWAVQEKARRLLAGKQEINALHELRKQKRVSIVLEENNRRNLQNAQLPLATRAQTGEKAGPPKYLCSAPEHPDSKPTLTRKCTVTAWGPFSAGKSTFFNAVMKEAVLPAEDKPTTSYLTRLHYGPEKIAVVSFPRQYTFFLAERARGKLNLKREEMNALSHYLSEEPAPLEISAIEAAVDGRYRKVNRQELMNRLKETKALCLSPYLQKKRALLDREAPLQKNGAVTAVRLTFKNAARVTYRLEWEKEDFHRLVTGPANLFIEAVDIYYPAELFKTATFLDTPGIDSVFAHHRQTCLQALAESDLLLVFIHGKQLMSAAYQKECLENIAGRAGDLIKSGRVLFLINFADTLTAVERERAANFVRRQLTPFLQNPPLFLISSLAAINGQDSNFAKVLRRIEEIIAAREICRGA